MSGTADRASNFVGIKREEFERDLIETIDKHPVTDPAKSDSARIALALMFVSRGLSEVASAAMAIADANRRRR